MSVQAMSWVIGHSPHGGSELLCLLMVANHARADGTGAFPSVPMLAEECRMSSRQVIRLLHRLEQSGALRIRRGAGPRGTHLMTVVMDNGTPKVASTPDILSPDSVSGGVTKRHRTPDKLAQGGDIAMSPKPSLEPSIEPSIGGARPGADAPTPSTAKGNPKVSAVIEALRAAGMTGKITPRDARAIKDTPHEPGEVAALYAAIYRGEYGDDWMHTKLSVALCLEYLPGWRSHRAGHRPPPPQSNRRLSGQAAVLASAAREGISNGRLSEAEVFGRGRGDAHLGHGQDGASVPRQLPRPEDHG